MDNHPIPQDVTHFQFKLIGELTIKQFGYVAAGGVLAWITFNLPIFFFVKLIIALLLVGTGLMFAFVPIEGRPTDLMLTYFFRALFQPNQYVFHKAGNEIAFIGHMKETPMPSQSVLSMQPAQALQPSQSFTQPFLQPMPQIIPAPPPMPPLPPPDLKIPNEKIDVPTTSPIPTTLSVIASPPEADVAIPTESVRTILNEIAAPALPAGRQVPQLVRNDNLQEQLQSTLSEKQQLEEQLAQLKQQIAQTSQPSPAISTPITNPSPTPAQPAVVSPIIKKVVPSQKTSQGPVASEFPNIIMGIVKDARGNILPNILIEVKDGDDNPVRAFKTNALGQFASATPLLNGAYTMLFEDPLKKHKFDALQIEATGEIMQPVEIISLDQREELRKELFG